MTGPYKTSGVRVQTLNLLIDSEEFDSLDAAMAYAAMVNDECRQSGYLALACHVYEWDGYGWNLAGAQ